MKELDANKPNTPHRKPNKKRQNSKRLRVKPPLKSEIWTIRLLISFGLFAMAAFLIWFIDPDHVGYKPLFWLLTAALGFKLLRMLHEWYHYFNVSVPQRPKLQTNFTVDILTTACPGEPQEMILRTLRAMQAIRYPHTSYLCDEGDDPELKQACKELGVVHVTRTVKVNAKAGNINNALQQATGDIAIVLDPDHEPDPSFIDRVLPYFEDPQIGFVQVVQAYSNRMESLVAKGAAEQTYSFYGPMMMCMNSYGTAQAIGANCTFRRAALDSIGGHAAGLSEDMHTAMQLHAKGWKSVYVPEILSRGLVPATLAAYYKQQLKWSRGTFELLVTTYIKLFSKFTWQQKLHYFTLPLYYLFGVFGLVDILVPVLALIMAQTPWRVDLAGFALTYFPLFGISLLIRQYAQRWLLERHERGFHVIGGIIRMGTWWVFTLGLIYTILRVRVPYIPTPKDDKPQNNIWLTLPNIIACLFSLGGIYYGLKLDWSPYSLFMAGFALVNVLILGFMVVLGQEKLLADTYAALARLFPVNTYIRMAKVVFWKLRHPVYNVLRQGAFFFGLLTFFFLLGRTVMNPGQDFELSSLNPPDMKSTGGFYTGIYLPEIDKSLAVQPVDDAAKAFQTNFDIVSFYLAWGPASVEQFPMQLMRDIRQRGGVPMITWEPWTSTFPDLATHPDLSHDYKMCEYIRKGLLDDYIKAFALKIRDYNEPVFLRFAHEPDNPSYPWSTTGGNTSGEYIAAWQHVVTLFGELGVSNVSWVWNPWQPAGIDTYFPGGKYVDWVGLTSLNYGKASSDAKWYSFDQLYQPYRTKLEPLKRPIMLAEFGSTSYGGEQTQWYADALHSIRKHYEEIRGLVFFQSKQDKNWATAWRPDHDNGFIDWTFKDTAQTLRAIRHHLSMAPFNDDPIKGIAATNTNLKPYSPGRSKFLQGAPGAYTLTVDGKPFYIKGVAYNTAHDWRDGNLPLTRRQVEQDFDQIKNLGANAIRRYSPGIYDENILNVADEKNLKVMYGFWFDPEIDYAKDSDKLNEYAENITKNVRKLKNHRSVLAWSVGNEAWGLLKHKYSKPYLTVVRNHYVEFVDRMARRIHEIDPDRPVLTAMEHERYQLQGEIQAYKAGAPSVDIIAVNSYYLENITQLQQTTQAIDPKRPYIVSEFGPRGYWNPDYTKYSDKGDLVEDTDFEKGVYYYLEWKKFVEAYKGSNLGGFAYSWRDRMEGTATWYGLSDFKGRLKPQYFALQRAWTAKKAPITLHSVHIGIPETPIEPGQTYEFKAITENNLSKTVKYEWYLRREEYLGYVNSITKLDNGRRVQVEIPEKPSKYRLYLYVSDRQGRVVTTSEPILVAGTGN